MKNKLLIDSLRQFTDVDKDDEGSELIRKGFTNSELSIVDGEERTVIYRITTPDTDEEGDLIVPTGCDLSRYKKNAPLLWAHQWSELPIGTATDVIVKEDGVYSKNKIFDHPFADGVWSCIKGGGLKCCSIGFVAKEYFVKGSKEFEKITKDLKLKISENTQRIISKWKIYENSIVNIPANEWAMLVSTSKSLNLSPEFAKKVGIKAELIKKEIIPEVKEEPKVIVSAKLDGIIDTALTSMGFVKEEAKADDKEVKEVCPDKGDCEFPQEECPMYNEDVEVCPYEKEVKDEKKESKEEVKTEEVKVEPKVEPVKVEEVKQEPVKVEPVKEEPKSTWVIIRDGDYKPTAVDKTVAKALRDGKIF